MSCSTLPSRKNVGGHSPMKIASRSARARVSRLSAAAERTHSDTAPKIDANPRL